MFTASRGFHIHSLADDSHVYSYSHKIKSLIIEISRIYEKKEHLTGLWMT